MPSPRAGLTAGLEVLAQAAPAASDPDDRELADRGLAHYSRILDSE